MLARDLPLPPYELATRVGSLADAADPWDYYDQLGTAAMESLKSALPPGASFSGQRILDFGCGAGRVLRHFIAEGYGADLWGCDIDADSVAWVAEHLDPPVHAFVNDTIPPLPQPDDYFDIVCCVSVFTHLTSSWAEWLTELHRILKPGGLLLATFMGEGQSEPIAGETWDPDRVGMLVLRPGQAWELGGPMVLHSPWWISDHWGRAFDVLKLQPHGFAAAPGSGHGIVTLSKRVAGVDPGTLRAPGSDTREALALMHNVEKLSAELEDLRPWCVSLESENAQLRLRSERTELMLQSIRSSLSWRITAPLRRLKRIGDRSSSR